MRKIETEINKIINDFQNRRVVGACQRSKRDRLESNFDKVSVYLWRTMIAEVYNDKIVLNTNGWRSPTTKSRLNALLRLTGRNLSIYQKNFTWYVYDAQLGESKEFQDGMSFERML
jgi:hypothetical protein